MRNDSSRARRVIVMLFLAGLLAVLVLDRIVSRGSAGEPGITLDDFVGAEECGECHREQYRAWESSTHGRAGGSPRDVAILGKFNGNPLVFKDAVVIPQMDAQGGYRFVVKQEGSAEKVFPVDAVVGGGAMAGGGTQSYFSLFPDGTLRFLPFDFIRDENIWFVQLDEGDVWVPVTDTVSLHDLKNWPPNRILGDHSRFSNCQNCHGSQLTVRYEPPTRRFDTRYTSLRINCESCHGPGRKHVEFVNSGDPVEWPDMGLPSLSLLPKDESLNVCFACHATKDRLQPGYLPGKDLEAYYSLKLPILGSEPFLEDGRIRSFAYQQNHRYSDCYLNGSMTCVDCHDPHSLTYRDVNGRPLVGRFDNGQCVDCHPSKAEFPDRHSRHPEDSPGSLCTSCHMPYFQHRGIGTHLRFSRSDHTVSIPRPAFDASLGLEGACEQCHRDKSVAWLQAVTDRWYGPLKPPNRAVRKLLEAGETKDPMEAASLLLLDNEDHPLAQMMGLSRFVKEGIQSSPGSVLHPEAVERLKNLSRSDDLDIRALALAALDLCCREDAEIAVLLAEGVSALELGEDPVRLRWALALDFLGSRYFLKGDYASAVLAYGKAHRIHPDDASILINQGHAYFRKREVELAIQAYREGIEIDRENVSAYVSLAQAYLVLGKAARAREVLEEALRRDPGHRRAQFILRRLDSMESTGVPGSGSG
ncbi:MAG: tetratricopeptide repeat protein [Fidelibacterota bacterium]